MNLKQKKISKRKIINDSNYAILCLPREGSCKGNIYEVMSSKRKGEKRVWCLYTHKIPQSISWGTFLPPDFSNSMNDLHILEGVLQKYPQMYFYWSTETMEFMVIKSCDRNNACVTRPLVWISFGISSHSNLYLLHCHFAAVSFCPCVTLKYQIKIAFSERTSLLM